MAEIFEHQHSALALLCISAGPIRFGQLGARMSEHGASHHGDQKVTRALRALYQLGLVTPEPGRAHRAEAEYQVTAAGRDKAERLIAALASWGSFDGEWTSSQDITT
jgi:DNA-binding HxlR family transcriptional regulator